MSNQAAVNFVKQLSAAYSRFPISKDTLQLYSEKLSKWKLTQAQWDRALDLLIEGRQEEALPGLSEIYAGLRNASYSEYASRADAMGWLSFELNGKSYSIRVVNDRGIWLIASLVRRDAHGNLVELQKHVGEPVAVHIPREAKNVICSPDHPAKPEPEEMPAKERQEDLFADRVSESCGRKIA